MNHKVQKISIAFYLAYFLLFMIFPELFKTYTPHIIVLVSSLILLWAQYYYSKKNLKGGNQ
jgi:hypothetical protein